MKDFLSKKWALFSIILIICLASLVYYNKNTFSKGSSTPHLVPNSTILIPFSTSTDSVKVDYPLRLKIPAAGVDAEIEYVGLNSVGEMDVPKDTNNVAWFELGTLPGAEGSAAIAGHFDDKNGEASVFYNLKDLEKGDKLFIEDASGGLTTFVVRETRIYDSEAFAPEVFTSTDGRHLNLITCTGNWSRSKDKYMKRLVVFTDILP